MGAASSTPCADVQLGSGRAFVGYHESGDENNAQAGITFDTGHVMAADGAFHHYIMTRDDSTNEWRLIVDQIQTFSTVEPTGSFSGAIDMWMTSLFKGFAIEGDGRRFNGDISVFRVYEFVLNASEIAQNFASGPGQFSPLFVDESIARIPHLNSGWAEPRRCFRASHSISTSRSPSRFHRTS